MASLNQNGQKAIKRGPSLISLFLSLRFDSRLIIDNTLSFDNITSFDNSNTILRQQYHSVTAISVGASIIIWQHNISRQQQHVLLSRTQHYYFRLYHLLQIRYQPRKTSKENRYILFSFYISKMKSTNNLYRTKALLPPRLPRPILRPRRSRTLPPFGQREHQITEYSSKRHNLILQTQHPTLREQIPRIYRTRRLKPKSTNDSTSNSGKN